MSHGGMIPEVLYELFGGAPPDGSGDISEALPAATPHTVVVGDDYEAGTEGTARYMVVPEGSSTVFGVIVNDDEFPQWVLTADGSLVLGNGVYDPLHPDVPNDAPGLIGFQPSGGGCALYGGGAEVNIDAGRVEIDSPLQVRALSADDIYRHNADPLPQVELALNFYAVVGAPPANSEVSLDNADPLLATAMYIDLAGANDFTDLLRTFPAATITLVSNDYANWIRYDVTGRTEHAAYQEFAITFADSFGPISLVDAFADKVRITGRRGVEARNTEPADDTLLEGAYTTWLDPTAGNPVFNIKAKDANGDVFTASISLNAV